MTPRRPARLALGVAALPLVLGAVFVRPAAAQPAGFGSYALTGIAASARTAGDVGAAGGLAGLDIGSAQVTARLDGAPSAAVRAAPYEPGTLARTAVGQVNAGAGGQVLDVPDAEAQFPGGAGQARLTTVPDAANGPASSRAGTASATADAASATGSATGARFELSGAVVVEGSTSSVELRVADGALTAVARTVVDRVVVAGVLELRSVVATATISGSPSGQRPAADLVVGGASVGGQAVTVGSDGVLAAGTPVLPGPVPGPLPGPVGSAAGPTVEQLLAAAGVTVRTTGSTAAAGEGTAVADSGGVAVSVVTPGLPAGGVAGNRLDVVIGGAQLTAAATPAAPPVESPAAPAPPASAEPAVPGGTPATVVVPGTPGTPAVPAPPAAAAPQPARVLLAGRAVSASVLLAGFAVWQLLSLSTATLYALAERRRRLELAGWLS